MEWVETTAKTIEEAQELALDKLGVAEGDAEFELLEEPKQGLFGRTRGQARVRARVQPKGPRAKTERRDKRKKSSDRPSSEAKAAKPKDTATQAAPAKPKPRKKAEPNVAQDRAPKPQKESTPVEEVREQVSTFLTGLTVAFGFDSTVTIPEDPDTLNASIDGKHGIMIGPRGRTLDAIQELTRVAAQRTAPSSVRIRVDVGGYRDVRKAALTSFAADAAAKSRDEGLEVVLEPMSSADRKTLHDALNDEAGVGTRSAGNEPRRRVIVVPADEGADTE